MLEIIYIQCLTSIHAPPRRRRRRCRRRRRRCQQGKIEQKKKKNEDLSWEIVLSRNCAIVSHYFFFKCSKIIHIKILNFQCPGITHITISSRISLQ